MSRDHPPEDYHVCKQSTFELCKMIAEQLGFEITEQDRGVVERPHSSGLSCRELTCYSFHDGADHGTLTESDSGLWELDITFPVTREAAQAWLEGERLKRRVRYAASSG